MKTSQTHAPSTEAPMTDLPPRPPIVPIKYKGIINIMLYYIVSYCTIDNRNRYNIQETLHRCAGRCIDCRPVLSAKKSPRFFTM